MQPPSVYQSVARLHIRNIDQGFLAALGENFLTLLYEAIEQEPTSLLLLAREGTEVVGFVAASTAGLRPIMRRMLAHPLRLGASLLPALVSPSKLARMIEVVSGGSSAPAVPLPRAELLSIAVDPEHRGRGHAQKLYESLCLQFIGRGEREFRVVVGDGLARAHRFYRQLGARPAATMEVHKGKSSTVYVQCCTDLRPS